MRLLAPISATRRAAHQAHHRRGRRGGAARGSARHSDAAAAVQVQEHAPPAKDAVATHESEQQALDEKFAFVKQAEAAPKAAAEPESQSPESSAE